MGGYLKALAQEQPRGVEHELGAGGVVIPLHDDEGLVAGEAGVYCL